MGRPSRGPGGGVGGSSSPPGHQPRQSGRLSSSSRSAQTSAAIPITWTSTVSARAKTSLVTPEAYPYSAGCLGGAWRAVQRERRAGRGEGAGDVLARAHGRGAEGDLDVDAVGAEARVDVVEDGRGQAAGLDRLDRRPYGQLVAAEPAGGAAAAEDPGQLAEDEVA